MKKIKKWILFVFLAFPASTNFKLEGYSLGNGGGGEMTSSNYGVQTDIGEITVNSSGVSYDLGAGLAFVRQSHTPPAVTLSNPSSYYNKLKMVINPGDNVSDTTFAVAISDDNWATMKYVKGDMTVGNSLVVGDYLTYTQWGDTGGVYVIGLDPGKTYKVKVKSMQGKYTETDWGPEASAATTNPTLSFDIDVSATDSSTNPPYLITLADLVPGSVVTSDERVWVSIDTNSTSGGSIFVYGQNSGLYSVSVGYTIPSLSGDLTVLNNGFGIQGVGATQTTGGPLTIDNSYNLNSNNVGVVDSLVRQMFVFNTPISAGRGSMVVKAKSDNNTPAAADYTETLTIIASANY